MQFVQNSQSDKNVISFVIWTICQQINQAAERLSLLLMHFQYRKIVELNSEQLYW